MIATEIEKSIKNESKLVMALSGTDDIYHLEQKFCHLVEVPYSLCMCNATMGLWAIWQALGLKGCEVITTPLTWAGTIAGLLQADNQPIFVDVDPDTLCLDPKKVERAINTKTRAILSVDIFGVPSYGKALRKIADKHGLHLVLDCSQSFGSIADGHHTGYYADVTVFSLGPNKILSGGEGAVLVTPHKDLYQNLVILTQHPSRQKRDVPQMDTNEFFFNLRIHPIAAIWANSRLYKILKDVKKRRKDCIRILEMLSKDKIIAEPKIDFNRIKPNFYEFSVLPRSKYKEPLKYKRDYMIRMSKLNITELLYQQKAFQELAQAKGWRISNCLVAEEQIKKRMYLEFN